MSSLPTQNLLVLLNSELFQGGLFPSHVNQQLAATKEILPHLIGKDPRETTRINEIMDLICPYLNYAKAPIDMACWDIFAKVTKNLRCIAF